MSVGIPNHEHTNSRAYPLPAVHHSHHAQANQSLPTNSVEVYQEFPGYSFTQEQALNFPPQSGTLDQPLPGIQPLLWFPPSVGPEYWEKLAPLSTICQNVTSQTAESLPTRDSTMMNFSSERSRVIENQCWKKTELHRPSTTPTKTAPCDNGYVWPSSCYAGAIHDLNDISQPPSVCSEADQLVPASSAFKAGIAEEHDNLSRLLRNIPSQPVVCNGSDQDSDDATPSALTILSTCQADASAKSPLDSSKEPEDFHESIECNTNNSCMEDPLFVDYDTCFGMGAPHNSEDMATDVEFKIRGNWTTVHYKDSMEYSGLLDHNTSLALVKLAQVQSVTLAATIPIQNTNRSMRSKCELSSNYKLQIVVYGLS
ncbi:hypothetical protein AOQ84DRAFT_388886 [Glonium stellatum]|uniref:Uncharacterized protein n=1 Tax=Glonium stellatum TaxID=574774 RepID=A0A8E2F0M2_9PEZI|nr:hypothetical protein AOQ84DRAFT_388886 [Glonium stellatum]